MSRERPLRYWQLVELDDPRTEALTATRLRIDARIVSFIKGLNVVDERLGTVVRPLGPVLEGMLPPSHEATVRQIVTALTEEPGGEHPPVIELVGVDPTVRRGLAVCAAHEVGHELYELTPQRVAAAAVGVSELTLLWERETLLLPVLLYADVADLPSEETHGIDALLEDLRGRLLVGCREPWPLRGRRLRVVDVARPTAEEQEALWDGVLGDGQRESARLAAQFDLNQSVIADVARQVAHAGAPGGAWPACRSQARPRLDTLAVRVEPTASWDDLVLPAEELGLLHHLVDQVRGRFTVLRSWGMAERVKRGSAVTALFAGASGTGKTLAAEVIANELELDMYRIDLAGVVSKYIGETERTCAACSTRPRRAAQCSLFDEADALFGKRSEVKDSHDRYANIEVNYLLQRMEEYRGVAILASNQRHALDEAFLRRLRFDRPLPVPGARRASAPVGAGLPPARAGQRARRRAAGPPRRQRRDDPQHRAQRRLTAPPGEGAA